MENLEQILKLWENGRIEGQNKGADDEEGLRV
jgi:hypothetical protein